MLTKQISPDHHYDPATGHMLIGYTIRLQSSSSISEKAHISLEVDGVDGKGKNRKSKAYTLVEAPVNIKSIDAEIRLDCPLKSSGKAANMAYKLEPLESHEIEIEAIEYEGMSDAVNSDGTT